MLSKAAAVPPLRSLIISMRYASYTISWVAEKKATQNADKAVLIIDSAGLQYPRVIMEMIRPVCENSVYPLLWPTFLIKMGLACNPQEEPKQILDYKEC